MIIYLYFGCVLAVLFVFTIAIVLVARATKWKPKPVKPIWVMLIVWSAVFLAGLVSSIVSRDIHLLYWWLLGIPIAAVVLPVIFILANLCGRLFAITLVFIFGRHK